VNNIFVKWFPQPNNWSEVVVVKFYARACDHHKTDGVKCHSIFQSKSMDVLDVANTKGWNYGTKEV